MPDIAVALPGGKAGTIDAVALASLPEVRVQATAHDQTHDYAGVDLLAALQAAGLKPARSLKGDALGWVVVATAADGYRAVFSLAELDPSLGARQVVLVHTMDGSPLGKGSGPWRLVVPDETRPARWLRGLTSMEVKDSR